MTDSMNAGGRAAEVRRIRRMLKDLADLAQHATLTGSLQGGAAAAVNRYNATLDRLRELGLAPSGFAALSPTASYDEVGVESASLAGYLRDDENGESASCGTRARGMKVVVGLAPFVDQDVLVDLVQANTTPGEQLDPGLIIALAPFLPREEISRLVRDNMETLRRRKAAEEPQQPAEPTQAARPPEQNMTVYGANAQSAPNAEQTLADLTAQLEMLAGRLRDRGLPDDERARLLAEVSRVAGRCAQIERSLPPGR